MSSQTSPVPLDCIAIAVRAAAEGVPVAAIARTVRLPYDRVLHYLQRAKRLGAISEIPRPDWPTNDTGSRRSGRTPKPAGSALMPAEDVEFLCRHILHLTNLEAGFLTLLLRTLFAEKEKLHAVIEQQRAARPLRPLQSEVTDPKMVDVMICKLRKKLTPRGIEVRTSWGKGYYLDQPVKDAVYRMLDVGVADFPHAGPEPKEARARDASRHGGPHQSVAQG